MRSKLPLQAPPNPLLSLHATPLPLPTMPVPPPRRLLLTCPPHLLPHGLPLFVSSNSSPIKHPRLEPAGASFHASALRLLGISQSQESQLFDELCDQKEKISSASVDSFQFKGRKKSGPGQEQQDHYAFLGLGHLRYLASEDQIRRCYREAALRHHPDKQAALLLAEETDEAKEAKKEEIDGHFKAIQEAYEVLIDPVKRRVYDSTDEFDDAVPGDCALQDFYKVYGPVFTRNGRWSVIQEVPSLGDDTTTLEEVDKFYDFWYGFKSWREFPHADEFDLEQAESREHKRWMERQNAKLREKAKKEENARVRALVENAYKRDPRILRRREEDKAEKLRRKHAKAQAKKEKEEEATRLLEQQRVRKEEEERRAAEEAAAQKKSKEREKKLLRKERSRLRAIAAEMVAGKALGISEDDIESLCTSLELDRLKGLCENLEDKSTQEQTLILKETLSQVANNSSSRPQTGEDQKGNQEGPDQGKQRAVSILSTAEKADRPWSREEVELLRKAVQKYPKGTSQRWEVVSNYIGTGRSVEEILKAVKNVLLQKPDSSKVFDSFLEKRKVSNVVISSPLSTRDDTPNGTDVPNGTAVRPISASSLVANGSIKGSKAQCNQKEERSKSVIIDEVEGKSEQQVISNGSQPIANGGSLGSEQQDLWSDVQEGALIKALKAFPKDTPQRWDRIAAAVPGKTKVQCFRKFAELRENFRSKKGAD